MNKYRILVVDDDESIRSTMNAILESEGYIVDIASSGKEAIQKTKQNKYNVALLDIRLPDMEGVELLELLHDGIPRIRKIMVTGYPSIQNSVAAVNKRADAYLIKPVDPDNLLAIIKEQINLQEEEQKFSEKKVAEFVAIRMEEAAINHV
jgi:two-component system nitrogen regulation response regulator GlnG